jgi:hypothetical protein
MKTTPLLLLLLLLATASLWAQNDLMKELEASTAPDNDAPVMQTFKGTRLINGQTVETKGAGELEFIFAHRFGAVNTGLYELFGLDQAFVRLGLEYGITDKIGVGIGRNSVDKTMDGYLRYKLLSQTQANMPVTVTLFAQAAVQTSPRKRDASFDIRTQDRLAYVSQLLIARKVSYMLSLQLMPTIVHKNTVDRTRENNTQSAIGVGGRVKVSRSIALTTEYYYRAGVPDANLATNPLGFGIDIETGGHVFQLVMSNTRGLTERAYLTETTGNFFDGDIHLGFNVTRSFQIKKQK